MWVLDEGLTMVHNRVVVVVAVAGRSLAAVWDVGLCDCDEMRLQDAIKTAVLAAST